MTEERDCPHCLLREAADEIELQVQSIPVETLDFGDLQRRGRLMSLVERIRNLVGGGEGE